jgi:hypothetical protein
MNLAAIIGLYLLMSVRGQAVQAAGQTPGATSPDPSTQQSQSGVPESQPQAPESQGSEPAQTSPNPGGQTASPGGPAKPSPKRRHKKTIPNCSNAPTALNPAAGTPTDAANTTDAGLVDAGSTNTGSTDAASANTGSVNPSSTNPGSAALKPCPPPKKVVRNGGSDEPTIQLTGGTTAEQAVHQRSTEQLTAATEENLKKIVGRQLNPSEQEMVSKIKQFMAQSKTAVAAGDLGRGHDLALKAHLLSDELVQP